MPLVDGVHKYVDGDTVSPFPDYGNLLGDSVRARLVGHDTALAAATAYGTWARATNQPVVSSAFSLLAANTAVEVTAGHFASDGAGGITILTAGIYVMGARVVWAANGTGRRIIILTRNCPSIDASGVMLSGGFHVGGTGTSPMGASTFPQEARSDRFVCNAGDKLRAFVFQDSGGMLNAEAGAANHYLGRTMLAVHRVA